MAVPSPGAMSAAECQLRAVMSEMKAVRRSIDAEQRRQRSANASICKKVRCVATLHIACVILGLMAPRTDLALAYVSEKRRHKKDAGDWTEEVLLQHFNKFTLLEKKELLDPADAQWRQWLVAGKLWLQQRNLRMWVTEQNMNKGVAPCNEHIWHQKRSSVDVSIGDGALRPKPVPAMKRRQRNQWIKRWAGRCDVRHGHFKNGDGLSQETLQAKVFQNEATENFRTARSKNRVQFGDRKRGPKLGPRNMFVKETGAIFRSRFWDHNFEPDLFFVREFSVSAGPCNVAVEQFLGK